MELLNNKAIIINPKIQGGVPVLAGTRIPVAQILAELASCQTPIEIAEEYDIDAVAIRTLLEDLSVYFNKSFTKDDSE